MTSDNTETFQKILNLVLSPDPANWELAKAMTASQYDVLSQHERERLDENIRWLAVDPEGLRLFHTKTCVYLQPREFRKKGGGYYYHILLINEPDAPHKMGSLFNPDHVYDMLKLLNPDIIIHNLLF